MEFAEKYALPFDGELGKSILRKNDFQELFYLCWGRIHFNAFWGTELNVKVILKVHRSNGICEHFIVDTDGCDVCWDAHKRVTRDFFIHPFPRTNGHVQCVKFSYIVHIQGRSIPSQYDYIFMDGYCFDKEEYQRQEITNKWITPNTYHTYELDAGVLQRDVDWYNHNFDSLGLIPKFTKGCPYHPYHPKEFIHNHINKMIWKKHADPQGYHTIKVCVDCVDDTDFINHLLYASENGVHVQCIVDWRKMMLTNSENYALLKRSGVELLGDFCTPQDPLIEVAPDMHTKFILFGDQDCILGSFNITFDRWGANWESGMTFHSSGVCRLLDNIFQSVHGGYIQEYGIDPFSHFNLLYTFGRHSILGGKYYRPHHAIIAEISRARYSIKLCLFLIGELQGEHNDSVVDALIQAKDRGVDVQLLLNGHLARQGNPGQEYTMKEELKRPLLPAVQRLKHNGVSIALAYGCNDDRVPYSPIHSKYCIIDNYIVLEGSFNWYNTSVFSHDLLVIAANQNIAGPYIYEFNQILKLFRIFY